MLFRSLVSAGSVALTAPVLEPGSPELLALALWEPPVVGVGSPVVVVSGLPVVVTAVVELLLPSPAEPAEVVPASPQASASVGTSERERRHELFQTIPTSIQAAIVGVGRRGVSVRNRPMCGAVGARRGAPGYQRHCAYGDLVGRGRTGAPVLGARGWW